MLHRIPFRLAVNGTLFLLTLVLVFHLLVVVRVIPYTIVWAGKLRSAAQMYRFEAVSISINALVMAVVARRGGYLGPRAPRGLLRVVLSGLGALFALNTVGNLFAETSFETIVFTPLTLVLALLCFRLALEPAA